jgi:hypothetical protein
MMRRPGLGHDLQKPIDKMPDFLPFDRLRVVARPGRLGDLVGDVGARVAGVREDHLVSPAQCARVPDHRSDPSMDRNLNEPCREAVPEVPPAPQYFLRFSQGRKYPDSGARPLVSGQRTAQLIVRDVEAEARLGEEEVEAGDGQHRADSRRDPPALTGESEPAISSREPC